MEGVCGYFGREECSPLVKCPRLAWNEILKYLGPQDLLALRETCVTTRDVVEEYLKLEETLENVVVALSPDSVSKFVEDVKILPCTNFAMWMQGESFKSMMGMEAFSQVFGSRMKKLEIDTLVECVPGDPDFIFYESLSSLQELKIETLLGKDICRINMLVPLGFTRLVVLDIEKTETFFFELVIESQVGNRNLRVLRLPELRIDDFVVEDQVEGLICSLTKLGEARKSDLQSYSLLEIDFTRVTEVFYITMYEHDEFDDEDNLPALERSLRIPFHPTEEKFLMSMIRSKIRLKYVYSAFLQRLTQQDPDKFRVPLSEFFSCVTEITDGDGIATCLWKVDTPNLTSFSNVQFVSRDENSVHEQERRVPNWNNLKYVGINQYRIMPKDPILPLILDGHPKPSVTSVYLAFKPVTDDLSFEKIFFQDIISVFPSLKTLHFTMLSDFTIQDFLKVFKLLGEKTAIEELSLTLPFNTAPNILIEDALLLNLKHMTSLTISTTTSSKFQGGPEPTLLTDAVFERVFSQLRLRQLAIESILIWPNVTQAGVASMINGPLAKTIKVLRFPMLLKNAPDQECTAFMKAVMNFQYVASNRRRGRIEC